jgi:hypothetical protein
VTVLTAGCHIASPSPRTPPGSAGFPDASWNDGMALISVFRGRIRRYGVWRDALIRDYAIREYLDPADLTKRDAVVPGLVPVVKINRLTDFSTGTYDYHLTSSLFFRRDSGELLKGVGVCVNGCGVVFHRWDAVSRRLRSDSYWEKEGVVDIALSRGAQVRFADELPFVAGRLGDGTEIRVLPPLASPRSIVRAPAADDATASLGIGAHCAACEEHLGPALETEAPDARTVAAIPLRVERRGRTTRLVGPGGTVELEVRHDAHGFVESWTLRDEQTFRRVAWYRGPYWQKTRPEDASLLEPR